MTASATSRNDFWLCVAAFAAIYVIWGTTYLAINIAIRTLPPFMTGSARFLLAALLLYAWLKARTEEPFANMDLRSSVLCGVLLSGIGNGLVVWAQQRIPTGITALIVASVPVIVVVLDWLFFSRRRPSRRASLGTCIALAGVVAIILHTGSLSGSVEPVYLVSMLVAATAWSFGTLLQSRAAVGGMVLAFTCLQMLFGGLFQLLMAGITQEWTRLDLRGVSGESLLAVAYLVVFGSLIAFTAYLWLLRRVSAQKVTTYALVNPVVALVLGAWLLGESVTVFEMTAAAMVLSGVALVLFQDWKPRMSRHLAPSASRPPKRSVTARQVTSPSTDPGRTELSDHVISRTGH
jgi:drug/metabolite transporter (DMT)-like permease